MADEEQGISRHINSPRPETQRSMAETIKQSLAGAGFPGTQMIPTDWNQFHEGISGARTGLAETVAEGIDTAADYYGSKFMPKTDPFAPTAQSIALKNAPTQSYESPEAWRKRTIGADPSAYPIADSSYSVTEMQSLEDPAIIDARAQAVEEDLNLLDQINIESGPASFQDELGEEVLMTPEVVGLEAQMLSEKSGISADEAQKVIDKVVGGRGGKSVKTAVDPKNVKLTLGEQLEAQAQAILIGKHGTVAPQHQMALSRMNDLTEINNRVKKLADDSYTNTEIIRKNQIKNAEYIEQARVIDLAEKRQNLWVEEDSRRAQGIAHDEMYGPQGYMTKWKKEIETHKEMVRTDATENSGGPYGFSSWEKVLNTTVAALALGSQVALNMVASKKGFEMPQFVMPMIMSSIDVTLKEQELNKRSNIKKGREAIDQGALLISAYKDQSAGIAGKKIIALEVVKKRAEAHMAELGEGAPGREMAQALIASADNQQILLESQVQRNAAQTMKANTEAHSNLASSMQAAETSKTAQGLSALNGVTAFKNLSKRPEEKERWNNKKLSEISQMGKFLQTTRTIKSLMSDILAESGDDFGTIQQALTMKFSDFIDKYSQMPSLLAKVTELDSVIRESILTRAKTIEDRLTNEDKRDYYQMFGTMDNKSMKNIYSRMLQSEYAVKEAYYTELTYIQGTKQYRNLDPQIRAHLNIADVDDAMNRFQASLIQRTQNKQELLRLDVGMETIDWASGKFAKSFTDPVDALNLTREFNQQIERFTPEAFEARKATEALRLQQKQNEDSGSTSSTSNGRPTTPGQTQAQSNGEGTKIAQILDTMKVTDSYGTDREDGRKHLGTDFKAAVNTKLYAPANGEIIEYGFTERGGNFMTLRTARYTFKFLHLNANAVNAGTNVKAGALIALTGATGTRKNGKPYSPHLHVQVQDNKTGDVINPGPILVAMQQFNDNSARA